MINPENNDIYDHLKKITKPEKKFRFVIINPGFINNHGHHYTMNIQLKKAVEFKGGEYIVLANKDIDTEQLTPTNAIPTFSNTTGEIIKIAEDPDQKMGIFEQELIDSATNLLKSNPDIPTFLFMYLSDVQYIVPVLECAKKFSSSTKFTFILNLFYSYLYFQKDYFSYDIKKEIISNILYSTREIRNKYNVYLTVETSQQQKLFKELCGEQILIIPSYTSIFDPVDKIPVPARKKKSDPLSIYLPSTSNDRDFELFTKLIDLLKKTGKISQFNFKIRLQRPFVRYIHNNAKKIKNDVEIIEGILTAHQYKKLFLNADVILMPYKKEEFYARTSGAYFDAIMAEKPVFVTSETWLGENTRHLLNGITFRGGDITSLYENLISFTTKYNDILKNCVPAKEKWLKANNPKIFIDLMLSLQTKRMPSTDDKKAKGKQPLPPSSEQHFITLNRIIQRLDNELKDSKIRLKQVESQKTKDLSNSKKIISDILHDNILPKFQSTLSKELGESLSSYMEELSSVIDQKSDDSEKSIIDVLNEEILPKFQSAFTKVFKKSLANHLVEIGTIINQKTNSSTIELKDLIDAKVEFSLNNITSLIQDKLMIEINKLEKKSIETISILASNNQILKDKEKTITQQHNELDLIKKRNIDREKLISIQHTQIELLRKKIDEKQNIINEQTQELKSIRTKIEEKGRTIIELAGKIVNYKEKIAENQKLISDKEILLHDLMNQLDQLNLTIKETEELSAKQLDDKIAGIMQKTIEEQRELMAKQKEFLRKDISSLSKQVKEYETVGEEHLKLINSLKTENDDHLKQIENLNHIREKTEKDVLIKEREIQKLLERGDNLKRETELLTKENKEQQEKIKSLQRNLEEIQSRISYKIARFISNPIATTKKTKS